MFSLLFIYYLLEPTSKYILSIIYKSFSIEYNTVFLLHIRQVIFRKSQLYLKCKANNEDPP